MKRKRKNHSGSTFKKANVIIDGLFFIVALVVFSIIGFISYDVFQDMRNDMIANPDFTQNESTAVLNEFEGRYPSMFDGLVVLAFLGLWGMVIIASFMIDSHPVFFFFSMILLVFVIIVGVYLGNAFETLFSSDQFTGLSDNFPITNWIMTHMLYVSIAIGVSILLVLYAKGKLQ